MNRHQRAPVAWQAVLTPLRAGTEPGNRAVLEAYGWHDLAQTTICEFLQKPARKPCGRKKWSGGAESPGLF